MKNFLLVVLIFITGLLLFSGSYEQNITSEEVIKEGVFIHVSRGVNEPRRVLMPLMLAERMAEDKDVILYFDIEGIEVLLKDSPDITFKEMPSSHKQIGKLLQMGITIMACPGCLKASGKKPEDLWDGIIVADKDKFFSFTDGRILTLNY